MKQVCVQGLGFVGSAMAAAVARADDDEGRPLYDVTGVDLPNYLGQQRIDALNGGQFPFETSDRKLEAAVADGRRRGNLRATTNTAAMPSKWASTCSRCVKANQVRPTHSNIRCTGQLIGQGATVSLHDPNVDWWEEL